ncbi:MAG: nucleoside recognition domain-containing protein, partial [Chthoniobacteraceae bacterium]|nr:nucleoside recognition domain-containing protein [Chthoniobacteraceae bacterium]
MLNPIWLWLVILAVFIGGFSGNLNAVTTGAAESAKDAVMVIALPLAGWFALWLGMMRLAELAGLIRVVARALRPVLRWLFPEVPSEHPALGAMAMNMAANMLGLGNAATPLGLKAMKHLEALNPRPGVASNAMCTFLAINTSSVQLIPATAIGILAINGAQHPTAIVSSAFLATLCAFATGITSVKFLEKLPRYQLPPLPPVPAAAQTAAPEESAEPAIPEPTPLTRNGKWLLGLYALAMAALAWTLAFPDQATAFFAMLHGWMPKVIPVFAFAPLSADLARLNLLPRLLSLLGLMALPLAFTFFPLYAWLRGVKVYEEFVEGAKEGFGVATRIIPFLVAILVAVGMFRKAGGIDLFSRVLGPALGAVGFPVDLLPLVLVRPLSGGATTGVFTEIVQHFGADSMNSLMAGTIF